MNKAENVACEARQSGRLRQFLRVSAKLPPGVGLWWPQDHLRQSPEKKTVDARGVACDKHTAHEIGKETNMKAKTLFAAGLLLAAAASASAQVYSVNAVGFVNVTIPAAISGTQPSFTIISNPLEASDNTLPALFPTVPNNCQIFKFNGVSFVTVGTFFFGWDNTTATLVPGEAFFFKNTGAAFTNTFVGNVKQGPLSTPLIQGFNMVASQVPQAGLLEQDLKLVPGNNDAVYTFNATLNRYNSPSTYFFGWDSEPFIDVAQGFFLKKSSAGSWTRTFSVNQ